MRHISWISLILLLCAGLAGQTPHDGGALLRAMHDRYQNDWYRTVSFTQKSTTIHPDGTTSSETWYEVAKLPGTLAIHIGDPRDGNGEILTDGQLKIYKARKVTSARPFVHMLLLLGFDVYRQPAATTIAETKGQGFDLSKIHTDTWEGEPVYVIGADRGDLRTKQFWISQSRLLFVRLIQPSRDGSHSTDTRFEDYRKLKPGWIAARCDFFTDGKETFREEYGDIRVNPNVGSKELSFGH